MTINMIPQRKSGIANPRNENQLAALLVIFPFLETAVVPMKIPSANAMISEDVMRVTVIGSRLRISSMAGVPNLMDLPKSPWKALRNQITYWA